MEQAITWSAEALELVRCSGVSIQHWSSYKGDDEIPGDEAGESMSFGDTSPLRRKLVTKGSDDCDADDPRTVFAILELCSGSDYGTTGYLGQANYKTFLEEHGSLPGVVEMSGGHGSFGIAIRLDMLPEHLAEVLATVHALENYPLLDDEELSRLEMDGADEAWTSWAASEFRDAMREQHGIELEDVSDDNLRQPFEDARDAANIYWEEDCGSGSMHVDVEKIAWGIPYPEAEEDFLSLPGARWAEDVLGPDGTLDPDALDLVRAAEERRRKQKEQEHVLRYNGHTVPYSDAFRRTHAARGEFLCSACQRTAVVNVRPVEGAPEQRLAFGPAIELRCSGKPAQGTCRHCEGPLACPAPEACAHRWAHAKTDVKGASD